MTALARAPVLKSTSCFVDRDRGTARRDWGYRPGSGRGRRGTSCSAAPRLRRGRSIPRSRRCSICGDNFDARRRVVGAARSARRTADRERARRRCRSRPRARGTARRGCCKRQPDEADDGRDNRDRRGDPDAGGEPRIAQRRDPLRALIGRCSDHDRRNRGAGRRQKMGDRKAVIHDRQRRPSARARARSR